MANFHIAFDDIDATLGNYFNESKNDILTYINANCLNPIVNLIPSARCNQAYIDLCIAAINSKNFLFLAYSHGEVDFLTATGNYYIHSDINAALFVNSLFYSMSCHTGKKLGLDIIANGSHAFIGYDDAAWALLPPFSKIGIECDNYGIKLFLNGETIENAYLKMKQYFTDQIDLSEDAGDIFIASALRRNRDALVLYGNKDLLFGVF